MNKRQSYSKEFKLEAVRLLETADKTAAEIARDLGMRRNQLYKWREQLRDKGEQAFSGKRGRPAADQASEIARLRKELDQVKLGRDILKKAAAYFAKELP